MTRTNGFRSDMRGYSPAPTCYGWTCPSCGHHWISVNRIGAMDCKCGFHKLDHGNIPYAAKLARKRERYRLLSEANTSLSADAEREALSR